jgi:hypothetical protein
MFWRIVRSERRKRQGQAAAMTWDCSSCGAHIDDQLMSCATCGVDRREPGRTALRQKSTDRSSVAKAGAVAAGGCAVEMLVWLLPVLVLGGTGLVLLKLGSKEAVDAFGRTNTEITSTGWVGAAFLCFAVAVFFGRGAIGSLYGMINSRTVWRHPWRVRDDVIGLGVATIAILVGLLSLAFAVGIIASPDADNPATGVDQSQVP